MRTFKKIDGKVYASTLHGAESPMPVYPPALFLKSLFSETARKELRVVRALKSESGSEEKNHWQNEKVEKLVGMNIGVTQAAFIRAFAKLNPEAEHILKRAV